MDIERDTKILIVYLCFAIVAITSLITMAIVSSPSKDTPISPLFELGDCLKELPEYNEWFPDTYQIVQVGNYSYRTALVQDAMKCTDSLSSEQYCKTVLFAHEARYKKIGCNQ